METTQTARLLVMANEKVITFCSRCFGQVNSRRLAVPRPGGVPISAEDDVPVGWFVIQRTLACCGLLVAHWQGITDVDSA